MRTLRARGGEQKYKGGEGRDLAILLKRRHFSLDFQRLINK